MQHKMNHEELAYRIEGRLDKIEKKLDKHLEQVSINRADISWIRGYIRISLSAMIAVITGTAISIFKLFFKS